jgi:hypothetical protein
MLIGAPPFTTIVGALALTTSGANRVSWRDQIKDIETLASTLENSIPFFKADPETITKLSDDASPADMDDVLGVEFFAYVEWKEFDSWSLESLNKIIPLV